MTNRTRKTGAEIYRARIERALAKGKTRQEARGHKPREHVARKEREIAEEGIAKSQKATIENWVNRRLAIQSQLAGELDTEDLINFARENGYAAFQEFRATWNATRRQYVQMLTNGTYVSPSGVPLDRIFGMVSLPDQWLYYH